ncbi:MAG: FtsX-like permease family protein [Tannerella sp.]|jgi:lipoprotein-releasing system permease protein|nr:FtsX-like permease family protein [Tannerella sp.]
MNFELFIARKVHFSKTAGDRQATPPAVRIAIIGITLGLATMLLSVAIIAGFKKEVRNKVIGFGAHIQITNFDNNTSYATKPIFVSDTLFDEIRFFPGIKHVERFATIPGLLKTENDSQGIVLKGIDENFDWTFFRKQLKEGEVITVVPEKTTTDVIISRYLANLFGLKCEDKFSAYFIQDYESNQIRARQFTIRGIYETGFLEYDKIFIYTDIKQVRRLNNWEDDAVSGLELFIVDHNQLDEIADQFYFHMIEKRDRAGNTFYARSIKELNPMIFNWLGLLDINVVIILVLMMAVSGFTMISGLLIIILERTNMIGILKALGQRNRSIRSVFLYISFFLIGKGMIWGNGIGLVICLIQYHFRIFKLNASDYYLDAVPIDLNFTNWLLINTGALTISLLMMLAPTYLISKINPARTIRFE